MKESRAETKPNMEGKAILEEIQKLLSHTQRAICISLTYLEAMDESSLDGNLEFYDGGMLLDEVKNERIISRQFAEMIEAAAKMYDGMVYFVGIKNQKTGKYVIVFMPDGIVTEAGEECVYVEYSDIESVEINEECMILTLKTGYDVLGDYTEHTGNRQVAIHTPENNMDILQILGNGIEQIIKNS